MKKHQPVIYPMDKVKPVEIIVPEYVALADEFIAIISKELPKYKKELTKLCYTKGIKRKEDIEDILNNQVVKCINRIRKDGFNKRADLANYGYSAYLTSTFSNAVINYSMKRVAELPSTDQHHILTSEQRYDEEHYLMNIKSAVYLYEDEVEASRYDDETDIDIETMYQEMVKKIKLENAFNQLTPEMKDVISLRFSSLKYHDISRILSIPISTVKSRLFIARGILKKRK
jgi:RNA polymerase sigma factor (sigma-70 family)